MKTTIAKNQKASERNYRLIYLRSFRSLYNSKQLKTMHWLNPIEFVGSINNSTLFIFKII